MAVQQVGDWVTVRGEAHEIIRVHNDTDGRMKFDLVKISDGTAWAYLGKRVTGNARLSEGDPAIARAVAHHRLRNAIDDNSARCHRCGVVMYGAAAIVDGPDGRLVAACQNTCPAGVNFHTAYPVGTEVMITDGFAMGAVARIEAVSDAYPPDGQGIAHYAGRAYVVTLPSWGRRPISEDYVKPTDERLTDEYAVVRKPAAQPGEMALESVPEIDATADTAVELVPEVTTPTADAARNTIAEDLPANRAAFTVDRDQLANGMAYLVKVAPKRAAVPVLAGVMIISDNDTVEMSTFDYGNVATVTIDATVTVPGRTVVSCRAFADTVKHLPKGTVSVSVEDGGTEAAITCGSARLCLPIMPAEDFPTLPDMPIAVGTVDVRALSSALGRVAVSAGTDKTLPTTLTVRVTAGADALTLATTDRYRAGLIDVPWSRSDAAAGEVLIPAKTTFEAVKRFASVAGKRGGTLTIGRKMTVSDNPISGTTHVPVTEWVSLAYDQYVFITRAHEGNFPPVESLFPKRVGATGTVEADALLAAIGRVSLASDRGVSVRLTWEADTLTVAAGSASEMRASETLPAIYDGADGFTVELNPTYLADGVKATCATTATFSFTSSIKPVVISGAGAAPNAYRYLVMPVRQSGSKPVDPTRVAEPEAADTASAETDLEESESVTAASGNITPAAPAPVPPSTVDAETAERVAHAAYLAFEAGDVTDALAKIAEGERMAPAHMVAGKFTWDQIRAAVHAKRDAAINTVPDTISRADTSTPVAPTTPTSAVKPTGKRKGVTITHGPAGTLMTGTPYPLRFKVSALLNGKRGGLGWTFDRGAGERGGWVLDGSAGAPVDPVKVRAAVDALATLNLVPAVDIDGYVPNASTGTTHVDPAVNAAPDPSGSAVHVDVPATVAPVDTPVSAEPLAPTAVEPIEPAAPMVDVAAAIRQALASMPEAVIAAAVAAAQAVPVVPATVTVPAAPVVPDTVAVPTSATLTFTLAAYRAESGMSYRASRRAVREALSRAGVRAAVKADESNRRTFIVHANDDPERVAAIVRGVATLAS